MRMNTTLVINPKGGSGKTTVTTSLASYFAARSVPVTVMDYDPQGSSLNWLRLRDTFRNRIYAANAAPQRGNRLRGIEMHVPPDTRQLIIDAPAGASGLLLQEMLARADCIVVPVAPSAIDIHATAGKGDVGFCNYWTLEISVKQPVRVYAGMPVGQLIYFAVDGRILTSYDKKLSAKYNAKTGLPTESMMWKNFS